MALKQLKVVCQKIQKHANLGRQIAFIGEYHRNIRIILDIVRKQSDEFARGNLVGH